MKLKPLYWILVKLPFAFVLFSFIVVILFKFIPVRYTPLMLKRSIQYRNNDKYQTIKQKWVSIEDISPELLHAVILAEDQRFYEHHGFDVKEIKTVWRNYKNGNGKLRGCSTISQQTAKNVFTLGSHTWIRKALESWWTVLIELIWGKQRILEVYMNVIELDMGVFGVGAAARINYNSDPQSISVSDVASLVSRIPCPLADRNSPSAIRAEMRKRSIIKALCKQSR